MPLLSLLKRKMVADIEDHERAFCYTQKHSLLDALSQRFTSGQGESSS